MVFRVSLTSMGTFCVFLLLRLIYLLKVYHTTRLKTCRHSLSKANPQANLAISTTRRDSPIKATLRASKGHTIIRKDHIITLLVNLLSLSRGINRDRPMVLGGKSSLLYQCNRSILSYLTLHISRDHPMVLLQVKLVSSEHLVLFHHRANRFIRYNPVSRLQANWPIWYNLGLTYNQVNLRNRRRLFIRANLFIQGRPLIRANLFIQGRPLTRVNLFIQGSPLIPFTLLNSLLIQCRSQINSCALRTRLRRVPLISSLLILRVVIILMVNHNRTITILEALSIHLLHPVLTMLSSQIQMLLIRGKHLIRARTLVIKPHTMVTRIQISLAIRIMPLTVRILRDRTHGGRDIHNHRGAWVPDLILGLAWELTLHCRSWLPWICRTFQS